MTQMICNFCTLDAYVIQLKTTDNNNIDKVVGRRRLKGQEYFISVSHRKRAPARFKYIRFSAPKDGVLQNHDFSTLVDTTVPAAKKLIIIKKKKITRLHRGHTHTHPHHPRNRHTTSDEIGCSTRRRHRFVTFCTIFYFFIFRRTAPRPHGVCLPRASRDRRSHGRRHPRAADRGSLARQQRQWGPGAAWPQQHSAHVRLSASHGSHGVYSRAVGQHTLICSRAHQSPPATTLGARPAHTARRHTSRRIGIAHHTRTHYTRYTPTDEPHGHCAERARTHTLASQRRIAKIAADLLADTFTSHFTPLTLHLQSCKTHTDMSI
ncbi:uncharacterized protein LOC112597453 [Melanaphis sacchari]|uniref:uncharacterized protein LOC112597453 n=1 Tax=Melanaphis sacchari TaxID=742174 RepID=UPI000DC13730|nr:uncharacterized protein LOC112597453 [Melanaphis sacchari]